MSYLIDTTKHEQIREDFIFNIINNLKSVTSDLVDLVEDKQLVYFSYHKNINKFQHRDFGVVISIKLEDHRRHILLGVFDDLKEYSIPEKIESEINAINNFLLVLNKNFFNDLPKINQHYYYYAEGIENNKTTIYGIYPEAFAPSDINKLKAI